MVSNKDTTVGNEETTTGMIEWSNRWQRRYIAKSNAIQWKLCEVKLYQKVIADKDRVLLRELIDKEIVCCQKMEETLRH